MQPGVVAAARKLQKAGGGQFGSFQLVRYDLMLDAALEPVRQQLFVVCTTVARVCAGLSLRLHSPPFSQMTGRCAQWLLEVNMSPNMIPHEGEEVKDTLWRVELMRDVAAIVAGLSGEAAKATMVTSADAPAADHCHSYVAGGAVCAADLGAGGGGGGLPLSPPPDDAATLAAGIVVPPTTTAAYQTLYQLCLGISAWRWDCALPAAPSTSAFAGDCACVGRLLQHKETGLFRCEELGPACGGASFELTLGKAVDMRWYAPALSV